MKKKSGILLTIFVSLLLLGIGACTPGEAEVLEGESDDKENGIAGASDLNWGIIEIRVTDPPPADVKSAVVWLTNIEVHRAPANTTESDNASGWITVLDSPSSFDLMELIGVEEILGSANLTAGKYTQIRMDVTEVTVVTTDNETYTAEIPGGKLRIVRPFTIGNGDTTILTLDFDGEKSLIRTGNDRFIFKPVVKLSIDKVEKGEKGTGQGEGEGDEDGDEEEGQNNNELEFEAVIVSINGDIWTVTADNVTTTVDVSGAETEGEAAAEGSQITVKGIMENDVLVASQVEIKEPEED